jgi:hypothetical protein
VRLKGGGREQLLIFWQLLEEDDGREKGTSERSGWRVSKLPREVDAKRRKVHYTNRQQHATRTPRWNNLIPVERFAL